MVFLLLFLFGIFSIACAATDDSFVLSRFRDHVHDPLGTLSSWETSTSVCIWNGVTCSVNGHVNGLNLQSLILSPSALTAVITMLPTLYELQIINSSFTGPLMEISPAKCSLKVLDLSHSQLSGNLSNNFVDSCEGLNLLNLSHNLLEGELGEFVIRRHLEVLDISYNGLSGSLPPSLFPESCKRLKYLDLSNNRFIGEVPSSMVRNCRSLQDISMAANCFSGVFPSLNTSNKVQTLNLAFNNFTEVGIHANVGCMSMRELNISVNNIKGGVFHLDVNVVQSGTAICPSLELLNISGNSFSGDFFTSLTGVTEQALNFGSFLPFLETLDASFNSFTGELPALHENIRFLDFSSNKLSGLSDSVCSKESSSKLDNLVLTNNGLSGDIFSSLIHCGSLELLDMSFNDLTGEIPDGLCDTLPQLRNLVLWMNRLQGHIPPSLGSCVNLAILMLNFNHLNGTIPADLSKLQKLWWLDLSNNLLTGTIPSSFGQLQQLQLLQLSGNLLSGEIPIELSNCSQLYVFQVNDNNLSGKIPARIGGLQHADIHPNESDGKLKSITAGQSKCKNIETAFLAQGISLEQMKESVLKRTSACQMVSLMVEPTYTFSITSMVSFDVSYNNLTGEIPPEIGDMHSLLGLHCQHNLLTGGIPAALGKLQHILLIDFSYNHLQGSIPANLGNLASLSHFNVSYNNLSGPIPQAAQLTTFTTSYDGNPYLCGLPTDKPCSFHHGEPSSPVDHSDDDDEVLIVGIVFALIAFFPSMVAAFYLYHLWM